MSVCVGGTVRDSPSSSAVVIVVAAVVVADGVVDVVADVIAIAAVGVADVITVVGVGAVGRRSSLGASQPPHASSSSPSV